ncbi:MAG TPA: phenylalanine--tRNA ligase subunit beta, partial [Candidatus Saccharimonadales bacterium]
MKVSLNIIRRLNEKYSSADDVTAIGTDELVKKIGAQLGGVDEVIDLGKKYQGIIISKVISCTKHPDADKLSLCKIDDGQVAKNVERDEQGYVQVVCGAPNVREGLTVAWLPPGTTVPETYDKEPFVLEAREIRGQKSNGMLASPKELALGDSHAGILELGEATPGSDFAQTLGLDDTILDIENKMFTHRPDCFGFIGIARELAGIQGMPYKSPDWYTPQPDFTAIEGSELPLEIRNELPELVPRFTAITMNGVKVGPSPVWLQVAQAELGQKSINNIVDYTNFYMLETGQPLHAYDYDKVKALGGDKPTIVVRNPKPNEKIKLLNGKEIEPRPEAVMIATDKQLIGIGGVMGGSQTEVDENTTNIILECANFDMYSIRRTSMTHGLFTDAVTRFTKGQSPLQNLAVLAKIVDEIRQHAGGKVAGPVLDDNHLEAAVLERNSLHPPVKLPVDFINVRLGLELPADKVKQLLENVEFQVETAGDELTVKAPFWRTDIELREDVVEEVGRLYGYDKLPLELPRRDLAPTAKDRLLELKADIRQKLSRAGANEVLTYSFVHGNLLDRVGQDRSKAFQIANALSPDLQYYRISLIPSLLEKVHPNIKAGYDEFALFELGKTHSTDHGTDDDGLP